MTHEFKCAAALEPGDLVDLEDDPYADPKRDHVEYQFKLATVYQAEYEAPDCVVVDFDATTVGFPPDHRVIVVTP
jgi:hypothetical protein